MIPIQKETVPVNVTIHIRKNIYTGEAYFDERVNIVYYHDVNESEDYYIKFVLSELIPRYQSKGKFFLLIDLRNAPKVGVTVMPLDKLDELYTFTKYTDKDALLVTNSRS